MANEPPPSGLEHDFEAIEAAVLETERGRWFLAEFTKRNRVVESEKVIGEIARLERLICERNPGDGHDQARADIASMIEVIETARREIRALGAPDGASAPGSGFEDLISPSESATSTILDAAEHLQEAVWGLREQGVSPRVCDALDGRITQVFAACEFQDIAAQRHRKLARALGVVGERLQSLAEQFGVPGQARMALLHASDPSLSQADVDFVLIDAETLAVGMQAEPVRLEPDLADPSLVGKPTPSMGLDVAARRQFKPRTLAEIDALPVRDRIRLFT